MVVAVRSIEVGWDMVSIVTANACPTFESIIVFNVAFALLFEAATSNLLVIDAAVVGWPDVDPASPGTLIV